MTGCPHADSEKKSITRNQFSSCFYYYINKYIFFKKKKHTTKQKKNILHRISSLFVWNSTENLTFDEWFEQKKKNNTNKTAKLKTGG